MNESGMTLFGSCFIVDLDRILNLDRRLGRRFAANDWKEGDLVPSSPFIICFRGGVLSPEVDGQTRTQAGRRSAGRLDSKWREAGSNPGWRE
jgi:hypothetical protein